VEWGERERNEMEGENSVGNLIGQHWFGFDLWSKSTYVILGYRNLAKSTHRYFWTRQIV